MRLHELLAGIDVLELVGDRHVEVSAVTHDSRDVVPGACFCCIPGARADGHDHAAEAIAAGATSLLVERMLSCSAPQVRVASVRAVLGAVAATFYGHPSSALRCLGVTGTNGKTTTTHLLEAVARRAGERVGVIGTLGARIGADRLPIERTTPEATELQALLARMRNAGVRAVAMEVSSHALDMRRVDGTRFAAVCFTNLSQDHLDYHPTMNAYFEAKARLFTTAFAATAAVGLDDPWGRALAERLRRATIPLRTWALEDPGADVGAHGTFAGRSGSTFTLVDRAGGDRTEVRLPLVGRFNVANALAAAATAIQAGYRFEVVAGALAEPLVVPGRLERIDAGQPFVVFVDYAHTPDALGNVLATSRELATGARVLLVFGCGGDRDRAKRPRMGRAAAAADCVWLTSDNPRSEDPAAIAAEAERGLRDASSGTGAEYEVVLDRAAAIRAAVAAARAGDVVLIAGKGHEQGQTAGGTTVPFDDRVEARVALDALEWR